MTLKYGDNQNYFDEFTVTSLIDYAPSLLSV